MAKHRQPIKEITIAATSEEALNKAIEDLKNDGYEVVAMHKTASSYCLKAKDIHPVFRPGFALED